MNNSFGKRALIGFLVLAATLCLCASAMAVYSGTCGENMTWTLDDEGTLIISGSGTIQSLNGDSNVNYPAVKSVVIENGATSIGEFAFIGYQDLVSVTIPSSVTSIDSYAFFDCASLTDVNMKYGIKSIGESAFDSCTSLASITIPGSVSEIGSYSFMFCTGLTDVNIMDGVKSIGTEAFSGCTSLTSITLPGSLIEDGGHVFRNCTGLKSVTLQKGIPCITFGEFYGCSSLDSVAIPDSVTSITQDAFINCPSLKSITIPASVIDLHPYAFDSTILIRAPKGSFAAQWALEYGFHLETFASPKKPKDEVTVSGGVYKLNHSKLTAVFTCPAKKTATKLTVKDTVSANGKTYKVTEIKAKACKGMKKLTTVTIGKNVTKIGKSAFEKCAKLKKITIKNAKMKKAGFGSNCFKGIYAKASFKVPKAALKNYASWIKSRGKAPKTATVKK